MIPEHHVSNLVSLHIICELRTFISSSSLARHWLGGFALLVRRERGWERSPGVLLPLGIPDFPDLEISFSGIFAVSRVPDGASLREIVMVEKHGSGVGSGAVAGAGIFFPESLFFPGPFGAVNAAAEAERCDLLFFPLLLSS